MTDDTERGEKKININQVVKYLNFAFARAMENSGLNSEAVAYTENGKRKTTPLYDYQVEFCYLVNEIQRGPAYIIPKIIQDANSLISKLENNETL